MLNMHMLGRQYLIIRLHCKGNFSDCHMQGCQTPAAALPGDGMRGSAARLWAPPWGC